MLNKKESDLDKKAFILQSRSTINQRPHGHIFLKPGPSLER